MNEPARNEDEEASLRREISKLERKNKLIIQIIASLTALTIAVVGIWRAQKWLLARNSDRDTSPTTNLIIAEERNPIHTGPGDQNIQYNYSTLSPEEEEKSAFNNFYASYAKLTQVAVDYDNALVNVTNPELRLSSAQELAPYSRALLSALSETEQLAVVAQSFGEDGTFVLDGLGYIRERVHIVDESISKRVHLLAEFDRFANNYRAATSRTYGHSLYDELEYSRAENDYKRAKDKNMREAKQIFARRNKAHIELFQRIRELNNRLYPDSD